MAQFHTSNNSFTFASNGTHTLWLLQLAATWHVCFSVTAYVVARCKCAIVREMVALLFVTLEKHTGLSNSDILAYISLFPSFAPQGWNVKFISYLAKHYVLQTHGDWALYFHVFLTSALVRGLLSVSYSCHFRHRDSHYTHYTRGWCALEPVWMMRREEKSCIYQDLKSES